MPWKFDRSVERNAATVLPVLLRRLFTTGNALLSSQQSKPEPDALHDFRLDVKRVRYTLEIFQSVLDSELATLFVQLQQLQQLLGAMNDCEQTRQFLLDQKLDVSAATVALLQQAYQSKRDQLSEFWPTTLGVKENQQRWLRLLAGKGSSKPSKA
jgi:CHAD domain-containing protein